LRDVVNAAEELEGFDDGDVPPELGALAKDHADCFYVLAALATAVHLFQREDVLFRT